MEFNLNFIIEGGLKQGPEMIEYEVRIAAKLVISAPVTICLSLQPKMYYKKCKSMIGADNFECEYFVV